MTDDYKRGLVTGLAMQPLCVVTGLSVAKKAVQDTITGGIVLDPLNVGMTVIATVQTLEEAASEDEDEDEDEEESI